MHYKNPEKVLTELSGSKLMVMSSGDHGQVNGGLGYFPVESVDHVRELALRSSTTLFDQDVFRDMVKEHEDEIVKVVPDELAGRCASKKAGTLHTHYNCVSNKPEVMRRNGDFNATILSEEFACTYKG